MMPNISKLELIIEGRVWLNNFKGNFSHWLDTDVRKQKMKKAANERMPLNLSKNYYLNNYMTLTELHIFCNATNMGRYDIFSSFINLKILHFHLDRNNLHYPHGRDAYIQRFITDFVNKDYHYLEKIFPGEIGENNYPYEKKMRECRELYYVFKQELIKPVL